MLLFSQDILFCLCCRLARMGNEDLRKAEEFVLLMRMHYTSTLAVSSEKSPTCGQILPILQKLRKHYTVQADDSAFVRSVKENIWNNLSKRYQVQSQTCNDKLIYDN